MTTLRRFSLFAAILLLPLASCGRLPDTGEPSAESLAGIWVDVDLAKEHPTTVINENDKKLAVLVLRADGTWAALYARSSLPYPRTLEMYEYEEGPRRKIFVSATVKQPYLNLLERGYMWEIKLHDIDHFTAENKQRGTFVAERYPKATFPGLDQILRQVERDRKW